ncbi:MAG TPA: 50S ribosomal protein L3 [Polyangiaceae bacterium]|nr:50S ribosomal protein L3 [Polyangiaceae bacterium]
MNQYPGVVGRKLGMTQLIAEDGTVSAVTVIEAHTTVVGKRTRDKDGYDALILGIDSVKEKHQSKAVRGQFKAKNIEPKRTQREFRCSAEYAAGKEIGQQLNLDEVFEAGQFLDVASLSRGRGFQGVVRRYKFAGSVQTHGTHEYRRHGGSIGTNMTPGRTKLGMRMPGQMGNKRVSVLSQRVAKVIADQHLVLVHGGVPGAKGGVVELRGAVKRGGGRVAK